MTCGVQVLLLLVQTIGAVALCQDCTLPQKPQALRRKRLLDIKRLGRAYLLGITAVEVYCAVLHGVLLQDRLPFLPLMLRSVYASLGVAAIWSKWTAAYLVLLCLKAKRK